MEIDPLYNRLWVLVDGKRIKQFPVGLGKQKTPTPIGEFTVINKYKNWGSGFGTRWIGLNVPWGIYGIHGTNRPDSIGRHQSHGCIRMYNRNVEILYEWVKIGTKVTIYGHPLGPPYEDPRPLAAGDSGIDVQLIQYRLKSAGYFNGICNGKFGPQTELAFKRFEKDHDLPIDGVMGRQDYEALGLWE
ncbi:L,D-transpeptidase family protein [Paenibacillus larvae]|uniref:L,D-transpeptidase family protein n=1 Tax=Paenibacillus larvae TaxID=1464 RepID=UPI001EEE9ACC|nr:L,D-transpeptidase family protein [Paenibacillus larvae]